MIDDPLWQKLIAMQIEPESAKLSFIRKLALENGWSRLEAQRIYAEYLRFLWLAASGPVCPSDAVDQAWHLHLTYTRHYWDVLCGEILQKPLHHGPTSGGEQQRSYHGSLYADTLARYEAVFGMPAPVDIWPDEGRRFGERFQRISRNSYWLLPKWPLLWRKLSARKD